MSSPDSIPTTLSDQLRHLGLGHTAAELNDLIARATHKRWSPVVLLEQLAQAELAAAPTDPATCVAEAGAACLMTGLPAEAR